MPFHKDAPTAHKAAVAAAKQGKFWEMHDKLFLDTKKLKDANVVAYAKELGLDMAKFEVDRKSPAVAKQITADQALARRLGARGTPAFFVNGWNLSGAKPFSAFKTRIDSELKLAEALLKKGIAKNKIYNELTKKGLTKAAPKKKPSAKDRPKRRQKDPKAVYRATLRGDEPSKGPADALVTIVESTDFQ